MTVGAYEAKTNLSRLLAEVAGGEEFTITRHGRAVVRLVPTSKPDRERVLCAIERIKELSRGKHATADEIRELIAEGRK